MACFREWQELVCPRPGIREWAEENLEIMTRDEFPLLCSEEALSLLVPVGCASALKQRCSCAA